MAVLFGARAHTHTHARTRARAHARTHARSPTHGPPPTHSACRRDRLKWAASRPEEEESCGEATVGEAESRGRCGLSE